MIKVNPLFKIANVVLVLACADFIYRGLLIAETDDLSTCIILLAMFLVVILNVSNNFVLIKKYETARTLSPRGEFFFWLIAWPFFLQMIFVSFGFIALGYELVAHLSRLPIFWEIRQFAIYLFITASSWYLVFAEPRLYFKMKKNYTNKVSAIVNDFANNH